jgi:hypothetical protein
LSFVVDGGAFAIPSGDALTGAAVEPFEDLRAHAKSFQPLEGKEALSCPFHDCRCVWTTLITVMWTPRNLKLSTRSTTTWMRACSPLLHDQLLGLTGVEGEVVVMAPHCQLSDLLPVGGLIATSDLIRPTTIMTSANLKENSTQTIFWYLFH